MNSRGKLTELIKGASMFRAGQVNAPSIYYNGSPFTSASGNGVDTLGYDDAVLVVDVGSFVGPLATINHTLLESDTDDVTQATAISSATFTVTPSNQNTRYEAAVHTRDHKRYLFLKQDFQGVSNLFTVQYQADITLATNNQPPAKTLQFDL